MRSNLGEDLSAESLILLEEPWVTAADDQACRTSAATWFTTMHDGQEAASKAAQMEQDCTLGHGRYGWTKERYAQAVEAIAAREELKVEGMIGVSFGARRSLYLDNATMWTALVNPAPRQMSATDYLKARHDAL